MVTAVTVTPVGKLSYSRKRRTKFRCNAFIRFLNFVQYVANTNGKKSRDNNLNYATFHTEPNACTYSTIYRRKQKSHSLALLDDAYSVYTGSKYSQKSLS